MRQVSLHQEYRLRRVRSLLEAGRPVTPANIGVAFTIEGPLDRPALLGAIHAAVARHEQLTTAFGWRGEDDFFGCPRPVREDQICTVVELTGDDPDAAAARVMAAYGAIPFDPTRAPLVRAELYAVAPLRHHLMLTVDHLVADSWSLTVLLRDIGDAYAGRLTGGPAPSYADFVGWQRGWVGGPQFEEQVAHWMSTLDGVGPFPEMPLPIYRDGGAAQHRAAEHHRTELPEAVGKGLAAVCARLRVGDYSALLAVVAAYVHRLTGRTDLTFATPLLGRDLRRDAEVVGWFANLALARVEVRPGEPVGDLVRRLHESVMAMQRNQFVPRVEVLRRMGERYLQPRQTRWTFFAVKDDDALALRLAGLDVRVLPQPTMVAGPGLSLYGVRRRGEGLIAVEAEHATGEIAAGDTVAMLRDLAGALARLADADPARLRTEDLFGAGEETGEPAGEGDHDG